MSSVNLLQESVVGTLQRCLEKLEESATVEERVIGVCIDLQCHVSACVCDYTQEWIGKGREYLTPVYLPVKAKYKVHLHMFSTAT